MSGAFGQTIKETNLQQIFLTGPGEDLVQKTLLQMSAIKNNTTQAFVELFGPYTPFGGKDPKQDQQRWANYSRHDWSIRQLPVINVYEAESQEKSSSNAWVTGNINVMVLWAPNQRRSDLARMQMAFNGALQNFFESQQTVDMLDELYWIQRPAKVAGLNEYGKNMTWVPNVEGLVADEVVPVTLVNVKYRLDLRAWYRALEFQERTKQAPYQKPLSDLTVIGGDYAGVLENDGSGVQVIVPDETTVSNG